MKLFTRTFPACSIPQIELTFNSDTFTWQDIKKQIHEHDLQEYVIFLPGIKIKVNSLYKIPFLFNSRFYYVNCKLVRYIKEIINLLLFSLCYIEINFYVYNNRDYILLKIDNEIIFEHRLHFENQDKIDLFYTQSAKRSEFITEYKWIPSQNILHPFTPGGGGYRCAVLRLFQSLALTDDTYNFFVNHEVFYSTATNPDILSLCKSFQHCASIRKAFKEHSYIWPTEDSLDNLSVIENNGLFKITNANHRICCAKRFHVPYLYARVVLPPSSYFEGRSFSVPSSVKCVNGRNIDILKSFNNTLEKIGLKQCHGDYLLEHGLRGTALLHFIETTTGKSLIQLEQQNTHDQQHM